MKGLINFVLKNKLAVWLLTIIVVASGLYSGTKMKMESIPDVSIPYLIVMGVYPGATAEQVMDEISIPMEKNIEGLDDVKAVYSNSSANVSQVQVEYDYGVDMDEKKRELEAALDNVNMPEDAEEPSIMALNMNMMPVVALSISSTDEDIVALSSRVEDSILPKIENLEGVGSATITGQHVEEVQFTYDQEKMQQLGLTEDTVKQMVQANDMAVSLGLQEYEDGEEALAVDGDIKTVEALKELVIPVQIGSQPFTTLGDIATIETVGKVQSISRTNGEDAIAIQITKGQQANTVDVVNAVKDLAADEEEAIDDLAIDVTLDQGEPIEESVFTMLEKALFGGLFAVLIILLFLRNFKSTIISIISIPVSILMAMLLLNWMDITLNIMTLGAITVAIGRVIDDSIVVVENIYRRMYLESEKLRGRALIREATIEMFKPILSSTLVTIAVFAPLMLVGGMVGELFQPFALTMAFALGASLIVAITIVPALSHFLFRKNLYADKQVMEHKEVGKLANWYKGVLSKVLNHKVITSVVAVLILVGSVAITPLIGFSFLGSEEEKVMYLTYTPAAGELDEDKIEHVEEVEQELMKRDDVDILQVSINDSSSASADMSSMMMGGSNGALMYVIFDDEMENFAEVKTDIEDYVTNIDQPGEWQSQNFSTGGMSSNEVSYTLYSEDLDELNEAVNQVTGALSDVEDLTDVESDMENPYVKNVLNVDQQDVLQYGLTTAQIVGALSASGSEEVLTTVESDGEEIDVIVQREAKTDAASMEELLETPIPTAQGSTMELGELVSVEEGTAYNTLARSEGEYYATVSGTVTTDDVSSATSAADEKLDELELPNSVRADVAGVAADMQETFTQLGVAMLAAILIVYFILVVTFGEGLAPFAILFSLPFTVIGSFVGLWIAGETISVSVMMGMLMLIGIVVTNAIVLVDRIIHLERDGMSIREAIVDAGATRLRPILMTAIATIGALLPMVFGAGGSAFISKGLAITVIGGLTSSTILTLVIVPIVYEVLSKMMKKDRKNIEEN
ncbi:efflux RND transporter permease subunit [Gracilibacillus salinarum]|uniref:Efflux RND transporter permease subunit n=1 Tax=Gracilibacillus salinarum TaxID=2932255 RepID=A0ABY4GGE6_9BACI|nr:efflux RND transporter permease subunit [Gracilibacillus salinarum]UOQ83393.1 efflux RND transporter permease subunit [Gracilibacillus salinarum]